MLIQIVAKQVVELVQILPCHDIVQIAFEGDGNHNSGKEQHEANGNRGRLDRMLFDFA